MPHLVCVSPFALRMDLIHCIVLVIARAFVAQQIAGLYAVFEGSVVP